MTEVNALLPIFENVCEEAGCAAEIGDGTVCAEGSYLVTINESSEPEGGSSGSVSNSDACETGAASSGDGSDTEEG